MITIKVSGVREIVRDLAAMPAALRGDTRATMNAILSRLHQIVATEKITAGGILESRSGLLRQSLDSRIETPSETEITGRLFFDLSVAKYGRLQEFGGTVTPTRSKNLAIPFPGGPALTDKGAARFGAREFISNPGVGGFQSAFVAKGVIFGKLLHEITPVFILKPSVTLPAREPLKSTLDRERPWIESQFDALAARAATHINSNTGGSNE